MLLGLPCAYRVIALQERAVDLHAKDTFVESDVPLQFDLSSQVVPTSTLNYYLPCTRAGFALGSHIFVMGLFFCFRYLEMEN